MCGTHPAELARAHLLRLDDWTIRRVQVCEPPNVGYFAGWHPVQCRQGLRMPRHRGGLDWGVHGTEWRAHRCCSWRQRLIRRRLQHAHAMSRLPLRCCAPFSGSDTMHTVHDAASANAKLGTHLRHAVSEAS